MIKTKKVFDKKSLKKEDISEEKDIIERKKWTEKTEKKRYTFWERWNLKKKPELSFLVTMLYPNGTAKEYIVLGSKKLFRIQGRDFWIDTEKALYNLNQNQYHMFYHYNMALPLDPKEVKQVVDSEDDKIFLSVNSSNLKGVIEEEYVKVLAQSQELSTYLKLSLILSAITFFFMIIFGIVIYILAKNVDKLGAIK